MKRVLDLLAEGKTYVDIAAELGVSNGTISSWRRENVSFELECTRARVIGFDCEAESLDIIARDEPDVNRARLMCDNKKWRLARQAPQKYGDKIDINLNQTIDARGVLEEIERRKLPQCSRDDSIIVENTVIQGDSTNESTECESGPLENEDEDIFG